MEQLHRTSAGRMLALLTRGEATPDLFRAALLNVPKAERDAWLDFVLGLEHLPDDGPELPRGCTPYLPCPVDACCARWSTPRYRPSVKLRSVHASDGRALWHHSSYEACVIQISSAGVPA